MTSEDEQKIRISGMWDCLKRFDGYISAVNVRCGLIASFSVAVFGGVLLKADQLMHGGGTVELLITLFLAATALAALLSIYFVVKTIWPDLRTNVQGKNKPSIFFFGSIADNFTPDTYADALSGISADEFQRDLAIQVHEVATVTKEKFRLVSRAKTCVNIMVFFLICTVVLVVFNSLGVRLCVA
ncbi:Pycsar system effector family protein [Pseudomonas oryzihabitans]|uniref:Pycsar system effector family protein n=1 Tax=Pseudomonas oryzihabitans TaxID=47885 RepID=UPI0011A69CE1|nr:MULTISPECIES: Pycsar system effector family protein [Pseudomonas]UUW72353.1 DUF5706 domain-containing protein [Pseudomonas psychrotolerans]